MRAAVWVLSGERSGASLRFGDPVTVGGLSYQISLLTVLASPFSGLLRVPHIAARPETQNRKSAPQTGGSRGGDPPPEVKQANGETVEGGAKTRKTKRRACDRIFSGNKAFSLRPRLETPNLTTVMTLRAIGRSPSDAWARDHHYTSRASGKSGEFHGT